MFNQINSENAINKLYYLQSIVDKCNKPYKVVRCVDCAALCYCNKLTPAGHQFRIQTEILK